MHINNYRGMVNDRPLDTVITAPTEDNYQPPANQPNFLDNVLAHVNNHNVVPMKDVEGIYDKGQC